MVLVRGNLQSHKIKDYLLVFIMHHESSSHVNRDPLEAEVSMKRIINDRSVTAGAQWSSANAGVIARIRDGSDSKLLSSLHFPPSTNCDLNALSSLTMATHATTVAPLPSATPFTTLQAQPTHIDLTLDDEPLDHGRQIKRLRTEYGSRDVSQSNSPTPTLSTPSPSSSFSSIAPLTRIQQLSLQAQPPLPSSITAYTCS